MRELAIAGSPCPASGPYYDPRHRRSRIICWNAFSRTDPAGAPVGRDMTYVATAAGWVYTAFVQDLYSRRMVGWQVADHLQRRATKPHSTHSKMAIWARGEGAVDGLVHHSDRGVQYTSIRYAERLDQIGAARSVGGEHGGGHVHMVRRWWGLGCRV